MTQKQQTEFEKFDTALTKVMSISHDELVRRDTKWKRQQKRKKRAKA
jgi:hypothetical protein